MINKPYRPSFALAAFTLPFSLSAMSLTVQAQESTAPLTKDTRAGVIEEVVVTAQRRDESLSETPVAVSVISADTLADAQITSEQDLRFAAPGLSVRAGLSSGQLNYALRGQSQDAFSGTRPGVMPYVNEVQIGGAGAASAFYDLQSVQVLKGPQGTLFGRSATGGAVLFSTAKPTEELSGYASALAGDYNATKFEGAVSGAIVPGVLLGRIAGFTYSRDGFQDNRYDGGTEGDLDRYGLRVSLTANINDRISNDLMVDYYNADEESTVGILSGLLPLAAPGQPPYVPTEILYGGTANQAAADLAIDTIFAFLGGQVPRDVIEGFYNNYFADPRRNNNGLRGAFAAQQARSPYDINTDGNNFSQSENLIFTNATTIELSDNLTLKNILGYTHLDTSSGFEADGTAFNLSSAGTKGTDSSSDTFTEQLSEEVQLQGLAFDTRLSYVTGLYYSTEEATTNQDSRGFDILLGGIAEPHDYTITYDTYAAYGQGTYQLNDNGLAATVGLRYTSEEVGKETLPTDIQRVSLGEPAPAGFSYDQSETYNKLSWQFGLQNQISDSTLIYATTRRAYKSGGFNGSVSPQIGLADIGGDGYKTEEVTDLELGAKYQGTIADMPTRLSVAAYKNWLTDSQRTAFSLVRGSPASVTVNVPDGKVYGLELEGLIAPLPWLTLGGAVNYTDASYSKDSVSVNGDSQMFDRVPDSPKYSGTLFADASILLKDSLELVLHVDVYAQDESYTSPRSANNIGTTIDSYSLTNLRAGIQDLDSGWSLTANLKNAFDKEYYVGGLSTGEIYQVNTLVPGDPRTFTLEARYRF